MMVSDAKCSFTNLLIMITLYARPHRKAQDVEISRAKACAHHGVVEKMEKIILYSYDTSYRTVGEDMRGWAAYNFGDVIGRLTRLTKGISR